MKDAGHTGAVTAQPAADIAGLIAEAKQHRAANRLSAAVDGFSRVVEIDPHNGEAWRWLGILAFRSGDRTRARELVGRALSIDARDSAAHRVLGTIDECDGKLQAAYTSYRAACRIDPSQVAASIALARTALALGRAAEAIDAAEAAAARGVVDAELLRTLGAARALLSDYTGARAALEASLRIEPHANAFAHLGAVELQLNRTDAALVALERALERDAKHAEATLHVGIARLAQGAFSEALAAFERAIELGCEAAHVNYGRSLLLLGHYQRGWVHFGWDDALRRALPAFRALPMWDGAAIPGKRLLVWHEQGVGDTIQMARFLRAARALTGSLTLACPPETMRLLRSVAGVDTVVDVRQAVDFTKFDVWLPTIRLPVVFDVAPQTVPAPPYVHAEPERIEHFRARLAAPGRVRVGLVWSGNPNFTRNDVRSCGLQTLGALDAVPGIAWFALQQGPARTEPAPANMRIAAINGEVADYADTAAIIAQLDLVITVDTSVANLAGALGRPAWVLLAKTPDWRWHQTGDVSPWYPTLRLFRQRECGDWASVVADVAVELRKLVGEWGSRP